MKRQQDRDSPQSSKISRTSMSRFEESPRDRLTPDRDRREGRGMKSSFAQRQHGGSGSSRSRGGDDARNHDSRSSSEFSSSRSRSFDNKSLQYKVLCVSNINHKVSDALVKDALTREFKKYGDVSVKFLYDGNERMAYLYYRNAEDAREARHNRTRAVLFDKQLNVDPVYTDSDRGRGRKSYSPDDNNSYSSRPRAVSPAPSNTSSSSRRARHNSLDRNTLPVHPRDPPFRRDGGPQPHHHEFHHQHNMHREEKKEKFPNYLLHIPPEEDDKATRTLFIGNLEVNIQESELRRIFERYGVVEDIDVKRPPPGQGNAYAFIKFLNLDMAHRAKVEMSGQYIGKFQCKIGYGKATPTTRIWVGGLGPWASLSNLEREFDRFGAIKKIDFVKGDNHAYILYDSIDAAQAACQEMRGFPLGGPDRRLRVDFADTTPYNYRQPSPRGGNYRDESAGSERYVQHQRRFEPTDAVGQRNDYYPNQDADYTHWRNSGTGGYVNQQYDPYYDRNSNRNQRNDWTGGYGSSDRHNSDYRWTRDRATWRDDANNRDWNANDRRKRPRSPDANRDLNRTKDGDNFKHARTNLSDGGIPAGDRDRTPSSRGRRSPSPFHDAPNAHRDLRDQSPLVPSKDRRFGFDRTSETGGTKPPVHRRSDEFREEVEGNNGNGTATTPNTNASDSRNGFTAACNANTLQEMARYLTMLWHGCLVLKNSAFPIRMHCCQGDFKLVESLMNDSSGEAPLLRITQRLRMDQPKLDDVAKRVANSGHSGHCILVGFPGAQVQEELNNPIQQRPLRNLVTYLKQKEAAGVIALTANKDGAEPKENTGVLYAFPPCSFSGELLKRTSPNLTEEGMKEDYLVVVVVKGAI